MGYSGSLGTGTINPNFLNKFRVSRVATRKCVRVFQVRVQASGIGFYAHREPAPSHSKGLYSQAIILAREEGLASVIFASDCLSLVKRMNPLSIDRSEVGVVVLDMKRMADCFSFPFAM